MEWNGEHSNRVRLIASNWNALYKECIATHHDAASECSASKVTDAWENKRNLYALAEQQIDVSALV